MAAAGLFWALMVPRKMTGAEPAAMRVALPMVWLAPVERRLPLPNANWVPPEVAKTKSVPAPSILRALIWRKLSPGLLRAAVSAVTRKVGAVENTPATLAALMP